MSRNRRRRRRKPGALFRLYQRGRHGRWYADFSEFSDVIDGDPRMALIPEGAKLATTDSELAEEIALDLLEVLRERRRLRKSDGRTERVTLSDFLEHHLEEKERSGRVTDAWLKAARLRLTRAVDFFGGESDPARVSVSDVREWIQALKRIPNGRGGTLSEGSQLHHLSSLSNLFRRAQAEEVVPPGFNPVGSLLEKPQLRRNEAGWLEVDEAARFLEGARLHEPEEGRAGILFAHALIATFLLTGGRKSEVLGLAVDDVSFDRKIVTFRPHPWRRLKTQTSHRSVPLWPQLEEILREHVFGRSGPAGKLLFPSPRHEDEKPIRDLRKMLDAISERVEGFEPGDVRTKAFRHTYCAARLQTLDRGAPISPWTMAKEMGHGGRSLVDRVYGHLGDVRHRSEVVEFRVREEVGSEKGGER